MSIEHIEVNGHELTAFDLPPEPSETYSVWVDGLGEVVVEKGKPPEKSDVPAKYMRKLIPALCEQNAELARENAKLRKENDTLCRRIDELCREVGRLRRTAKRIVVSNHDTDCATGHSECSACGGTVNPFARYCEHCGALFKEGE